MKLIKRMTGLVVIMVSISAFIYGCGKENNTTNTEFPEAIENLSSQTLASNDMLSLRWDSEKFCLLLEQKETGKIWSTIPYDFYQGTEINEDMNSPIYIQYVDGVSMVSITDKGYTDCIKEGRASARLIENGIEVIYYFDGPKIAVPVQYILRDDALAISVDFANVQEGSNKLLSVSVAPFLCSVSNHVKDAYLVVPSGSGALMYVDERAEGTRNWSGEIYGDDPVRMLPEDLMESEAVRLPFFGVKDGEHALLGIVEEGDEAAFLTANAGDAGSAHSNAYVTFYARGFDISESQTAWAMNDVYRTEENIRARKSTVAFYPLVGETASYVGMAKHYQTYLKNQGMLTEQSEEKAFALYITGGAQVEELVLGIPDNKTKALTTFNQVQEILSEITEQTGKVPAVELRGFGESGLNSGKVAGGFDFASVFGSNRERQTLEKYCAQQGIALFTDFDLVYFRTGGKGVNTLLDAAKSASSHKVQLYQKDKALWHYDEDEKGSFLVGRKKLQAVVDKLEQMLEKKAISGVSLSTLGNIAYSDYSDSMYSARGSMDVDVQRAFKQLQKTGRKVATESANAYAAVVSDSIFETSVTDGEYIDLDARVPLYQMVFRGYADLYSTAVNTTEDYDRAVMLAVSSGTSLGFSIVGTYDVVFSMTPYTSLHASSYEGNKEALLKTVIHCADYYDAIQGQSITDYTFISDAVTKTTFRNGVVVYANHSDVAVESPIGQLEPYGFSYTSEGN